MTLRSVRARYRNGVLEPLDEIDLLEDEEVLLTVEQPSEETAPKVLPDMFEDPDGFINAIYQARLDGSRPHHPRTL